MTVRGKAFYIVSLRARLKLLQSRYFCNLAMVAPRVAIAVLWALLFSGRVSQKLTLSLPNVIFALLVPRLVRGER